MRRGLSLLLLGFVAEPASAGCSVATSGVAFGVYNPLSSSPRDTAGSMQVECSTPTALSIGLLPPASGSASSRRLQGERGTLAYSLHPDAARVTLWGDGAEGTVTVEVVATKASIPIFARIPARQNVIPGSYSDTVTVSVAF